MITSQESAREGKGDHEYMESIIALYLRFTGKQFTTSQRILSMVPGFVVFLVISPFVIFQLSRVLASFIPLDFPRSVEMILAASALFIAVLFMTCALWELWTKGEGTPAPITPTRRLVTSGPYSWSRNPIELGTNIYFFSLGTFFDSLVTGILCMLFGLMLGTAYIKLLEEREMRIRFGKAYEQYLLRVPFMSLLPGRQKLEEHNS